jgi:hypothetical protein
MPRALLITALLVTVLVESPLACPEPRVSGWVSASCDDRDDGITVSWLAVLVPCDTHGLVAPPLTSTLTVDRVAPVRLARTQPIFRLRDPPIRTAR